MKLLGFACAIFSLAAFTAGCGDEFGSAETTSTSGAGAAGSGGEGGRGAGGDGGQGGDGQGGTGGGGSLCAAGSANGQILLWTTLNDAASITQPKVGSGMEAGFVTGPQNDFVPGLSGNGIRIDTPGEYVRFRGVTSTTSNIHPERGTIDFCYKPSYTHTDGLDHAIFAAYFSLGYLRVRKAALNNANGLQVTAYNGTNTTQTQIPVANYQLAPGTWYRLTISWDFTVTTAETQVHVYIDGNEVFDPVAPIGEFAISQSSANDYTYIGAFSSSNDPPWHALGVIDEFVIYGEPIVP